MSKSKIEWTDETWSPVTGCTRVSAGCTNCYAARMTKRLAEHPNKRVRGKYIGLINPDKNHFNGMIRIHPDVLGDPYRWRKPRTVFVCSMSDLFHPEVPYWFIDAVFAVMAVTQEHTFQILTKRPERMATYFARFNYDKDDFRSYLGHGYTTAQSTLTSEASMNPHGIWDHLDAVFDNYQYPLPNIWLGASVENQQAADERIPYLLQCPASVRFLSCEPLLGSVDLSNYVQPQAPSYPWHPIESDKAGPWIDWVIVGGESGPNARPMLPDWPRSLRDQCNEAAVSFFMKQMDKKQPIPQDLIIRQFPEVCHVTG